MARPLCEGEIELTVDRTGLKLTRVLFFPGP